MDEVYTVLGFRPFAFDGNDGRHVTGTTLYVSHADKRVEGVVAEKFSVSTGVTGVDQLFVGATIRLFFNRYGKVCGLLYV